MEKVPEDILLVIFDLLRPKDLEGAAEVCPWWRNIIGNSKTLMPKLSTSFGSRMKSELPYQNFFASGLEPRANLNGQKYLSNIDCGQVKKLNISHSDAPAVAKFLNNFHNLSTLVIENPIRHAAQHQVINLPNLTHLKVRITGFRLLHVIRNHKIQCMRLTSAWSGTAKWTEKQIKTFGTFVQTLNALKHLTIDRFFSDQFLKLNAHLETLEVIRQDSPQRSAFLQFLKAQKGSLKNLLVAVGDIDEEAQNFIYFEMNLRKLWDLRESHNELRELHPINIKSLGIKANKNEISFFENLFSCCVHLEVLSINLPLGEEQEYLRIISSLPSLKFLRLRNFSRQEFPVPNVTFEHLQELVLQSVPHRNVVTLSRFCQNIRKLVFTPFNGKPLDLAEFDEILEACKKLKEIILLKISKVDENVIQTFKSIGSKVCLKIQLLVYVVQKENINEQTKNRTIVMRSFSDNDDKKFSVKFRILTDFYYDDDKYDDDIEYEYNNDDFDGYSS